MIAEAEELNLVAHGYEPQLDSDLPPAAFGEVLTITSMERIIWRNN